MNVGQSGFSLDWMAWTMPVAIFFIAIAVMLVVFGVLQFVWPTVERRGFLPVATTRGDRLFMGLLGAGYIHLGWLALSDASLLFASALAAVFMAVMLRWG